MQLGVRCSRGLISWDECLTRCVHNALHPCDYTADMLNAMRVDYEDPDREPGVESFTPTRLLGCPRQPALQAGADYYVDVDQAYPAFRGNMVHALMERTTFPGAVQVIREHRFALTVMTRYGPQPFTAKPDLVVVKRVDYDETMKATLHVKIVDYKSTGDIGHDFTAAKLEHQLQANMYAWIVSRCLLDVVELPEAEDVEIVIDEVEIVYCSMKKIRRFTSAGERQTRGKMRTRKPATYESITLEPIRLWDLGKLHRYIIRKIEERIAAKTTLPDILEGEDAWLCDYCPVKALCYEIGNVGRELTPAHSGRGALTFGEGKEAESA
jgi:hypothetical protein